MDTSRLSINDEQRRNLASSLRHDAAYGEGSLSEWWGRLQFIVLDEDDFPNPREVFEGLADLIEPQPIDGNTSDGYHTFDELYHHRAVLFSVIVENFATRAWKSKLHADGTMYDGMFIVGIETPDGQATYHYDVEPYWNLFRCKEVDRAPEWDGHTPDQAIERIGKLVDCETDRPTCRKRIPDEMKGLVFCSNCGAEIGEYSVPNYCPNCGRQVVK